MAQLTSQSGDEYDIWFAQYQVKQKCYLNRRKAYHTDRKALNELIDNLQQQLDDSVGHLCRSRHDTDGHVLVRFRSDDTFLCVRCGGNTPHGRLLETQEYSHYYAVCRGHTDSSGHCFRVDTCTCERCGVHSDTL